MPSLVLGLGCHGNGGNGQLRQRMFLHQCSGQEIEFSQEGTNFRGVEMIAGKQNGGALARPRKEMASPLSPTRLLTEFQMVWMRSSFYVQYLCCLLFRNLAWNAFMSL